MKQIIALSNKYYLYIVFLIGLGAVFGSLFFSEVEDLNPCVLCWYQRILMYPMFLVSLVALASKDTKVAKYFLTFSAIGAPIALYHYLLQKTDFVPKGICGGTGLTCSFIDWEILGFVTIPLLSFLAFTTILILSIIKIRSESE